MCDVFIWSFKLHELHSVQVIWVWNSESSHSTANSCGELRVSQLSRKWTGFVLGSGIFCSSLNYIALLGHLSLPDMHIADYCGFVCLVPQKNSDLLRHRFLTDNACNVCDPWKWVSLYM